MIKSIKNLLLSLFLLAISTPLFASHVQGGNISYKCTGNPNEFIITLVVFQDCTGIPGSQSYPLYIFNDCGLPLPTPVIVSIVDTLEVSQLCPDTLGSSPCTSNNNGLPGSWQYVYQTTVTLTGLCDAWTFGWTACARNSADNIAGGCFYVETKLFSATQACNNSVTINNPQPIPYVCVGQGVNYDYGVQEQDGDSLHFELVGALQDSNSVINYTSPYTATSPIANIFINSETGAINFNSPIGGYFVVAVLVSEYNKCGELVGQTRHDMQFVIDANCINNAPYQIADPNGPPNDPPGIYNFNNFNTNATLLPGNKIDMCVGDKFCFDIAFDDNDATDIIQITSNITQFLPGASIIQTATSPVAIATVCWEFQQGYTGNIISVNATDNQCPIPGIVSRVVELKIPPALFPGQDDTVNFCGDEGVINFDDYLGPVFDFNGVWHNGNSQIITGLADVDTLTPGVYYHIVYPDTSTTGCVDPPACVVADSAYLTINISNLNIADHVYVDESCQNQFDGTSAVGPITGNAGPFTVLWTAPNTVAGNYDTIVNNGGTGNYNNLFDDTPGLWNVLVTDQNGCTFSEDFEINQGFLEFTNEQVNNPQCFGFSNGSINLSANTTGGQNVTFVFTDANGVVVPGSTGNSANNLAAGVYTVTATTANGCLVSKNYLIENPAKITANFQYTMPLCHGLSTGKIKATQIFNQKGDIDDVFFAWAPAPAGHNGFGVDSLMNLPAGAYTLVFTEAGCSNDTTVYITEPDPLQVLIDRENLKKTYCRTAAYQNGNGVVAGSTAGQGFSGTGTPTYLWQNLANGDESVSTTFVVRVPGLMVFTATDENGCISSDTVLVDSLNPIADFTVVSDEFFDATIYEGTEEVKIKITNTSQNFAQIGNPLSDTIFQWNLFSNNPDGNKWFFTYALEDKVDTAYMAIERNYNPTEYEICLVAKNFNDCVDTTCRIVKVHKIPDLITPNVFTPGAYPNNEFFFPADGIREFKAVMLNRYGVKVFEFNDISDTWDGTNMKSDKPCSDGVYFYTYTAKTTNGTPMEGQGQVTLVRAKK